MLPYRSVSVKLICFTGPGFYRWLQTRLHFRQLHFCLAFSIFWGSNLLSVLSSSSRNKYCAGMPQKCTETKNQQFGNFSTCSIICRPPLHFTLADCLSCVVVSVRCHQVSPGLQTINIWRLVRVHQIIAGQMIQNTTIMNEHSYNKTNDFFLFSIHLCKELTPDIW